MRADGEVVEEMGDRTGVWWTGVGGMEAGTVGLGLRSRRLPDAEVQVFLMTRRPGRAAELLRLLGT